MKKLLFTIIIIIGGAVLTQGFQCESASMRTAKVAIKNKEWDKAITKLNEELQKHKSNADAWFSLFQVYNAKSDLGKATETLIEAEKFIADPKGKGDLAIKKYSFWVSLYNESTKYNSKYIETEKMKYIDSAVYCLDLANKIRDGKTIVEKTKSRFLSIKGDKEQAKITNEKYCDLLNEEVALIDAKNIYLGMSREEVTKNISGKLLKSIGTRPSPDVDSMITDIFQTENKKAIIFYGPNPANDFVMVGLRVDPPSEWNDEEKNRYSKLTFEPVFDLVQTYYAAKDYPNTMKYLNLITKIDPSNDDANRYIVGVLDASGDAEAAEKRVADLVKTQPQNKLFRSQYGDMLFRKNKYDEAIAQYEEAIKIDKEYCLPLRNLGPCYKNKAAMINKAEIEKNDKDKSYKINEAAYFPFLEKAADYFKKSRKCEEYRKDFTIMYELISIYNVTKKNKEAQKLLKKIEKMESKVKKDQLSKYYLTMYKIYSELEMPEKATEVEAKASR